MEEYQDLVMRLYWDCQELVTNLQENEGADRNKMIMSWLEKIDTKYPRLPEFKPEYHWINTDKPLTMDRLAGLVTLLDFFTYCCINCMHILPDLEALEKKYEGSKLAVVGIHSAKFENEKAGDHVGEAVARYGIKHPVCNDTEAWLWGVLGVTCWPTQLLLGPHGRPLWVSMGEGQAAWVDQLVAAALQLYGDRGSLTGQLLGPSSAGAAVRGSGVLAWPGKVAVAGDRVIISDTGHHRLLITDRAGRLLDTVGGPEAGCQDGDFAAARFRSPQGAVVAGDTVYVCDTDNQLVRAVDTVTRVVSTVGGAPGLSSPWDLVHLDLGERGQCLVVAMAGCHQLWLHALSDVSWWKGARHEAGSWASVVGSGREENRNNSYPAKAGLAQPSGLATDGHSWLYLADSESSTVRRVSLGDGAVTNVAGGERDPTNLFAYGDQDGAGVAARLQHPLGVSVDPATGLLYIADSYNHKIKKAELQGKLFTVTSVTGGLSEPGGLCVDSASNCVYIADTNNHCIKILSLATGTLDTLPLAMAAADTVDSPGKKEEAEVVTEHVIAGDETKLTLTADLGLAPGTSLNSEAGSSWRLVVSSGAELVSPAEARGEVTREGVAATLTAAAPLRPGSCVEVELHCKLYTCSDQGLCSVASVRRRARLTVVEGAPATNLHLGSLL